MKGAWSQNAVLSTIASDLSHAKVGEVRDGGIAQDAYFESIKPVTSASRKQQLTHDLMDYCKLNTHATARLSRFLANP